MSRRGNATADYQMLARRGGAFELAHWTQVRLSGADHRSLLHNFCTADIKNLSAGQGAEAFMLNVKGKIIAHLFAFADSDSIELVAAPDLGPGITQHLEKFIFREDVTVADVSNTRSLLLVSGRIGDQLWVPARLRPTCNLFSSSIQSFGGIQATVRRVDWISASDWLFACSTDDSQVLIAWLARNDCPTLAYEAFDIARIERGLPLYGRDITQDNLPQEIGRDRRAISFTKGCYLGQETVARIDALGHVNRRLAGMRFDEATRLPWPGLELLDQQRCVGRVTSATDSPKFGAFIAMGYLRRGCDRAGSRLASELGTVTVIQLGDTAAR